MLSAYSDSRFHDYLGPSRSLKHLRACTAGGGSIAKSQDGTRCAVAGKDVLRVLRITKFIGGSVGSIEAESNLWASSGLKMDTAPTDVVWPRAAFDNKLITSARNGEMVFWDVNKGKVEHRVKDHTRAISRLALLPYLPNYIASGAQDGYLRVWDLRTQTSTMRIFHSTSVRALAFCPTVSRPYMVCTGLESGNILRWDIRNKNHPLERITLAHVSSVLCMDWQAPSLREGGLGWIATGGMDRTVKIWNMCVPMGGSDNDIEKHKMGPSPYRTLHASYPVRCVRWRPGYDTELAIASNNETSENDATEIWDVRRGWIAKWALDGAEPGVTDMQFSGSHLLWSMNTKGTFAQHDMREMVRPLDCIPRVSMSWSATGSLAFVADEKPAVEVPFDDIDPNADKAAIHALGLRQKAMVDPIYCPMDQVIGSTDLQLSDRPSFVHLARQYLFRGDRTHACAHNAEAAYQVRHHKAAQAWRMLHTQLLPLREIKSMDENLPEETPVPAHSIILDSPVAPQPEAQSTVGLGISSRTSAAMSTRSHDTPGSSRSSSPYPSRPILQRPLSNKAPAGLTLSSQTGLQLENVHPEASRTFETPAAIRRASTVHPTTHTSRPQLRRASLSTPSAGSNSSPASDANNSRSTRGIGDGALDDSDSSNESPEHAELDGALLSAPAPSSPIPLELPPFAQESDKLEALPPPDWDAAGYDDYSDATLSPQSTSSEDSDVESSPHSPTKRLLNDLRGSQSPVASLRPASSLRLMSKGSHSSIKTVTGLGGEEPEHRASPGGLGLTNMMSTSIVETDRASAPPHRPYVEHRLTEMQQAEVLEEERYFRDLGWSVLRAMLEEFLEEGDVQMCAYMALLVPDELGIKPQRALRFVESYLDLLDRLKLSASAAYLRKHVAHEVIRRETQIQTTYQTLCGKCRKPIKVSSAVRHEVCQKCSVAPSSCSICRIPVTSLMIFCPICGHGGHQLCYRKFYLARPLTEIPWSGQSRLTSSTGSGGSVDSSSTYYSFPSDSEAVSTAGDDEDEESGSVSSAGATHPPVMVRTKMRIMGHECAAGCGHFCWAANERFSAATAAPASA